MEILSSIFVGAVAGGLASFVFRSAHCCRTTSIAVGILGGLLGLTSDFWLGGGGINHLVFSAPLASGVGAIIALTLWIVAQRLFIGEPAEKVVSD